MISLDTVIAWIKSEVALICIFVDAVIMLLVAYGVPVSDGQKVAIDGVAAAILGIVVRQNVVPLPKATAAVQVALHTPVPKTPPQ
jgi:hypothetical protein